MLAICIVGAAAWGAHVLQAQIAPDDPPTVTTVSCSPSNVPVGGSTVCTATVSNTTPSGAPLGTVFFTTSGSGSFSPNSCNLSPFNSTQSRCSVAYTPNTAGPHTITANYPGGRSTTNATMFPSSGATVVTASLRPTSTSVTCAPSTVPVDDSTVCTATVTDIGFGTPSTPTGTVTFTSDGVGTFTAAPGSTFVPPNSCVLSGSGSSASCSVTYTPAAQGTGTHTISATYSGDTKHSTSRNSTTVTVGKRTTTMNVNCAPSTIPVDDSTVCTATVTDTSSGTKSTPTGTVTFTSDGVGTFSPAAGSTFVPPNSCTLSGSGSSASCSLTYRPTAIATSPETHTIKGTYSGDGKHQVSTDSTTVTVTTRSTTTSVSCTPSSFEAGGSTLCTATVSDTANGTKSAPAGTVSWSSTPSSVGEQFAPNPCPLGPDPASPTAPYSICTVTFTATKATTYTIRADYNGDPKHATSFGTASVTVDPGPPATLELSPAADTNEVDTEHCVTATVADAFGNPTPNIRVRFSVTGVNSASTQAMTDMNGQATFCYVGRLFGPDVIGAYADTNKNGVNDPPCFTPEPCGGATKMWTLPPSSLFCEVKITDAGWITALNTDKATLGGNAKSDNGTLSGNQTYQDHGPVQPMTVKSTSVLAVVCNGDFTSASIFGKARIDGSGEYPYRILVQDLDKTNTPLPDTYGIFLPGYYSGEQPLGGGNITIH